MKKLFAATALVAIALSTSAFAAPKAVKVSDLPRLGDAPSVNRLPTDQGFACFRQYLATVKERPAFTVGKVVDQTGKFSNEANVGGALVTQGAQSMIYSALGKFGKDFNIVERSDTAVMENEIAMSMKKMLGLTGQEADPQQKRDYYAIWEGQYEGANYYITGAITEISSATASGGGEVNIMGIGVGRRKYTMLVGIDLRVVNARTGKVVDTVSMRKEVSGFETKAGVFNFLGDYLIDASAGTKSQEPLQVAVRVMLEDATLRLVGATYGTDFGATCAGHVEANYRW